MNADRSNKILRLYDATVRARPDYPPVMKVVHDGRVVRLEGPSFHYISHWAIPVHLTSDIVMDMARQYRKTGQRLAWRVYGHDEPANLEACLRQAGFEVGAPETLMVLPLDRYQPSTDEHDVRRIKSTDDLKGYLSVTAAAFGKIQPGDYDFFSRLLAAPAFAFFVARIDKMPVGAARLEMPGNKTFAPMFGGGVLPDYRGRGLYRALVNARAILAREQGMRFLSTEARQTSRPILERLGFIPQVGANIWTFGSP